MSLIAQQFYRKYLIIVHEEFADDFLRLLFAAIFVQKIHSPKHPLLQVCLCAVCLVVLRGGILKGPALLNHFASYQIYLPSLAPGVLSVLLQHHHHR